MAEVKADALPDLDDLLQCPVCYEIPTGQIFQCNEGHHVCGRCKSRLDMCPVCRAMFFGTRNYAMEELISNVRKLRAFKLGGKVTTSSISTENPAPALEESENDNENVTDEDNNRVSDDPPIRVPLACKGVFRCLCCKNGVRLPVARLLNHLRYFHSPELIEGRSENGEYLQAWQFATVAGRIVTAVRIADMGVFFLTIEISNDAVCAWLTMVSAPWVAHEFSYTVTVSGNDREAIFTDCVWSVKSCEGTLKKRGRCLSLSGLDARAITAPASISAKLSVRRAPADQLARHAQPRMVLRVASRGITRDNARAPVAQNLEPFLHDLQNDVARLSRAFATLGREANALVRSEAELQARIDSASRPNQNAPSADRPAASSQVAPPPSLHNNQQNNGDSQHLSRSARKRLRQRLRAALLAPPDAELAPPVLAPAPAPAPRANHPHQPASQSSQRRNGQASSTPSPHHLAAAQAGAAPPVAAPAPAPLQPSSGPSNGLPRNENQVRANKKKRRQRR